MPQHWKTYKLQDLVTKLGDGIHGTPKYDIDGEYYFINGNNLVNGKIIIKPDTKRINKSEFSKHKRELNSRTILVSINGTIGNVSTYNNEPVILGKSACYFNVQEDIDKDFIRYVVSSKKFLDYIESNYTGSVIKNVSLKSMREFPISLPPLNEQRAIASILSALDDKIELNLQMNRTLEEMAMALYKHWFVDFDPFKDGKFVESELGLIPEGWEVKTVGEAIETVGGGTPKTSESSFWLNGDIDWYSPTDLTSSNSLYSLGSAKKITSLGLAKSSAKLLPPNTLLMSSRATIGALTITRKVACTNQGFISMIPNEKISVYQLYCWAKFNMDLIESKANGSTFKEISKSEFRALPILVPCYINDYLEASKNIFQLIENNLIENQNLKNQRDTLLPKLISGEITIKDLKKLHE